MPGGHGEKLTRKQEQAIAALLSASSIRRAAKLAGVSERTLRTWLSDAGFQAAYRQERRRIVEHAIGYLQARLRRADKTLNRNLTCGKPAVEIAAAKTILEIAIKGIELGDLQEQVEELQAAVERLESTKSEGKVG